MIAERDDLPTQNLTVPTKEPASRPYVIPFFVQGIFAMCFGDKFVKEKDLKHVKYCKKVYVFVPSKKLTWTASESVGEVLGEEEVDGAVEEVVLGGVKEGETPSGPVLSRTGRDLSIKMRDLEYFLTQRIKGKWVIFIHFIMICL